MTFCNKHFTPQHCEVKTRPPDSPPKTTPSLGCYGGYMVSNKLCLVVETQGGFESLAGLQVSTLLYSVGFIRTHIWIAFLYPIYSCLSLSRLPTR